MAHGLLQSWGMGHLTANDVISPLRHDVLIGPDPQGLGDGLLSVTNLHSGEELRLHGFEVSIARLLDGHRTAREVVEAAWGLGLPLTLEGLEGFVHTLEGVDLVGVEGGQGPFDPRDPWDEKTRAFYRQALQEGRAGHLGASVAALDRMAAQAPWSIEEAKLRSQLTAPGTAAFPAIFAATQQKWRAMNDDVPIVAPHRARRAVVTAVVGVAAMLLVGAVVVPLPHTLKARADLVPATVRVLAPRSGVVAQVPVALGERVEEGAFLFAYDAPDLEVRAPKPGEVAELGVREGEAVKAGAPTVRLDDHRWLQAIVLLSAAELEGVAPGRPAVLTAGGRTLRTQVTGVAWDHAVIEIDNTDGAFRPGPGEVEIQARPAPLVTQLWH